MRIYISSPKEVSRRDGNILQARKTDISVNLPRLAEKTLKKDPRYDKRGVELGGKIWRQMSKGPSRRRDPWV